MRKSSARQNARSEAGQAGRQIGGAKRPAKPVRIVGYKELRIHLIRNDISIKKLGEEFEMQPGAMCRILKGHHPNSVFVDAVFKRIGVDRDSYFDGVPRKRVYVSKHKLKIVRRQSFAHKELCSTHKTLEREALLKRQR